MIECVFSIMTLEKSEDLGTVGLWIHENRVCIEVRASDRPLGNVPSRISECMMEYTMGDQWRTQLQSQGDDHVGMAVVIQS